MWRAACSGGAGASCSATLISRPRRKVLYQRAPRNIHRHVVLSEIKEAVAALRSVRSRPTAGSVPPAALPPVMVHAEPLRGRAMPAASVIPYGVQSGNLLFRAHGL